MRSIVRSSARRRIAICVAALLQSEAPSPFVEQLRGDGATVREIRAGRRRYRREARELADLIREWGATVVHTHVYHADFVGYWAARRCRLPVVATVHGFTGGDIRNRFYQWLDRRLLRRFDGVICVSQPVQEILRGSGISERRLHLVPNGYLEHDLLSRAAARTRLALDQTGRVIGWVGRLSHEKGADQLLLALADGKLDQTQAILIGEGPERASLEAQIAALGLEQRVRLAGHQEDASALLPAFDLMVVSSRTEGTPMVLLEAMGAGVPIAAFAVGGIPQVLDEESAWLIRPGDIKGLRDAIIHVMANPEEAGRRAGRGRGILREKFDALRWLDQICRVYAQVETGPSEVGSTTTPVP